MGGFKHTGAAAANASGQYLVYGQSAMGVITLDAGSVGAPSLTFSGDTNNGYWSPAADTQAWSIAGAEAMRLDSTGLGISSGHVLPGANATQNLGSNALRWASIYGVNFRDGTNGSFAASSGTTALLASGSQWTATNIYTGGSARVQINSAGNVTINAPASGAALSMTAPQAVVAHFQNSNGGAVDAGITFGSPGSSNLSAGIAAFAASATTGGLRFQYVTGGALTEGSRITETGLFGINATGGANARLEVNGGALRWGAFYSTTASNNYAAFYRNDAATIMGYFGSGTGLVTGGAETDFVMRSESALHLAIASNTRLRINSDGSIYGTALHNVGSPTGTTTQYIASGTYTPTVTNVGGTSAITARKSHWIRVGNEVHAVGTVTLSTTGSPTVAAVRISLPIASNLATTYDLSGTLGFSSNQDMLGGGIQGDAVNDAASASWWSVSNAGGMDVEFSFQYEVL